jgi:hypothetical protein
MSRRDVSASKLAGMSVDIFRPDNNGVTGKYTQLSALAAARPMTLGALKLEVELYVQSRDRTWHCQKVGKIAPLTARTPITHDPGVGGTSSFVPRVPLVMGDTLIDSGWSIYVFPGSWEPLPFPHIKCQISTVATVTPEPDLGL